MSRALRRCEPGEVGRFLGVCASAFGGAVGADDVERLSSVLEPGRLLLAEEDGEAIGSAGTVGFRLSLPGGEVDCAGVTMVGVDAAHRRRGVFRELMELVLADCRVRQEPLAVLWSTEGDLYRRFGFGLAAVAARIDSRREAIALAPGSFVSRIRHVDEREALRNIPALYDAVRRTVPGMPSRTEEWWRSYRLPGPLGTPSVPPLFHALLEVDGEPEGYALYRVHGAWEGGVSTARLDVVEALATTPRGTPALWRFLFGLDLVERVRALHLPVDHPLLLLARHPARLRLSLTDGLWARAIDVQAALEARSYERDGEAVLELRDELCPWNAGRWLVAVENHAADVRRTRRSPDLELAAPELGSVLLGGFGFARLARTGLVEERRSGAAAALDALLGAGPAPWCPEEF